MVCQEMANRPPTDIPVKIFLMNNRSLRHGPPVAGALLGRPLQVRRDGIEPGLGGACQRRLAGRAARCEDKGELAGAMRATLDADGPALLDVRVTQDENCFPMIPGARRGTWSADGSWNAKSS